MSPSRQLEESYKWQVVALLWLVFFLNQAARQALFSVFPLMQRELGLNDTQLGLLGSSFHWVYAVLVPVAGLLGDSTNRKRLILLALLVWSVTTFLSGLAGGFLSLLVFRALTGAGEALYYPAAASVIGDYHGQRTRAFALSIHQTSLYFGIIFSGVLAGYIGQRYGWRLAFFTFGALGILAGLLVGTVLREPARGLSDRLKGGSGAVGIESRRLSLKKRLAEFFCCPTAVVHMLAFMGMNFAAVAVLAWMPTLLYREFHYDLAAASFHSTFYHQLGAFLGVLVGGKLADRWAARSPVSRPLVQAAGLILAVPFVYLMGQSSSRATVLAALGLFGVFRGLYESNLFASLYEVIVPEARATVTGVMLALAFLVDGSSPLVIGKLSQYIGLGPALSSTFALYVAGGLLILLDCALWFRRDAAQMQVSERQNAGAPS
jgi:predicted MFS family arabinose efflux permease